jgi:cysteinyl-tRNA synthetase
MLIYNSLTRTKEEFQPLDGKTVKIYVCGPTVYDYSHLGHARVYIIWDFIRRYLRFKGYDVIYARNVTDVDDKIINKAKELGATPEMVARRFLFEFWHDMYALNIEAPHSEPRASEYVRDMIEFIQTLIEKKHAYAVDGDVYFDVASLPQYGQLTKQKLEDMMVGAREQVIAQSELEKRKKNPADFALWKHYEAQEDSGKYTGFSEEIRWQYGWESPWGRGRPGWHIECSTMVKDVLGETIDLHGGGEDLQFPHHENELAQSTALHNKPLARFWVHNGFIQVNSEKMSKSLGNFNTIRDLLKQYSADEIRLFILQTHYRNPIDFSPESLQASKIALQRLVRAVECLHIVSDDADKTQPADSSDNVVRTHVDLHPLAPERALFIQDFDKQFCAAMDNDFNTAQAVASLFGLAETVLKISDMQEKQKVAKVLQLYADILGLTLVDDRRKVPSHTGAKLIELLLRLRTQAKENKDYKTSDTIRAALGEYGVNVMDTKDGAAWEIGSN